MNQRVAVERGLVFMLGGDAPDRLAAPVNPRDRVTARQRVHRSAHTVVGAQPQRAVGHRYAGLFEVVESILQGVMQLIERQRHTAGGQQWR